MHRLSAFAIFAIIVVVPLISLAQEKSAQNAQGLNSSSPTFTSGSSQEGPAAKSCDNRSLLANFEDSRYQRIRQVPIWHVGEEAAFFFSTRMTIDADGAPNAYNPDNTGLDDIANAGEPGHWDGILADADGNPLVQSFDDPFPGYYISCTSLSDRSKRRDDPTRYVDASKIPYIVLPGGLARSVGARLGDFAVVLNQRSGRTSYAIFADVGTLGEGSIALADNLGIQSNARWGGRGGGVFYLIFPGTGNGQPRSVDEINQEGDKAFSAWGGAELLDSCAINAAQPPPVVAAQPGPDAAKALAP